VTDELVNVRYVVDDVEEAPSHNGSHDESGAQCPANAATTGASVSAEPAPKTK
jgi:hypothetical protein